jgi:hypothetical protein
MMPTHSGESGCCPVCDRQVPRFLAEGDGVTREVYACPEDGMVGYGALPVTLEQWIRGLAASPAA